jgi:BirA family biotin operon repressor/biotin-[acetyl-CoA-carboxylase] ligase
VEVGNRMLPAVGFWAALAAASAISKHIGRQPELKWPNDLLLEGKKCCGILSEGRSFGGTNRLAVGVGINVNRPPGEFQAAWLSDVVDRAIDRTQLTIDLLQEYERRFNSLGDPEGVIREWAAAAQLEGKQVAVRSPDGGVLHEGTASGIASDGALLLQTKSGPVTVRLGDVNAI